MSARPAHPETTSEQSLNVRPPVEKSESPRDRTNSVTAVSGKPAIVAEQRISFAVFQSEFDYVARTLRRLGVHPQDLEDQVHEVFLVLDRKWSEYDPSRPIRPYLFGIAFRVVASQRRRQKREVPTSFVELAGSAPQPDESLEASEARQLVLRALSRVPLLRRAVFVMHDIDEVPMRDIAQALSLPLFTGYSRLRKARREFEAAVRARSKGTSEP